MIADVLKNRQIYAAISPRIKTALEYIAKTDFSSMEPGRYELDGSNLFALVQAYDSIPESRENGSAIRTTLTFNILPKVLNR